MARQLGSKIGADLQQRAMGAKADVQGRAKGLFESIGSSVENAGILTNIGHGLDSFLGLNDPAAEEAGIMDRVSIGGAGYLTTVDQSSVTPATLGVHVPEKLLSSVDYPGTKQTQGERFFFLGNFDWDTTKIALQEVFQLDVVAALLKSEYSVSGLTRFHTYARFGLDVLVQINPTNFMQGGLIAALVPVDKALTAAASLTTFCHGKLNCNINNMVRLQVPFVYSRGMFSLRNPVYPIWKLYVYVLSKLQIATGTSPQCSVSVLARFTNLELHGLAPVIPISTKNLGKKPVLVPPSSDGQMMRSEVRISSSQNVVNMSNSEDARAKLSFALGQEHDSEDFSAAGGLDIKDFSTWTTIPCWAYNFTYPGNVASGKQIFQTTVDPFSFYGLENLKTGSEATPSTTNVAYVAYQYLYWRGDIVFDLQVFPTKFHSGRLLVFFLPGNENSDGSEITLQQASTGFCAIFDINGVNSTLRMRVPWVADTPYRTNRHATATYPNNYYATGKLYVYVYNRLTNPANVVSQVDVVVYKSAENLELFVPLYHSVPRDTNNPTPVAQMREMTDEELSDLQGRVAEIKANPPKEEGVGFSTIKPSVQRQIDQDADPLNPTGSRRGLKVTPYGATTALEDPNLAKQPPGTFPERDPGQRQHTGNHMSLHKLMGRAHWWFTATFSISDQVFSMPISLATFDLSKNEALPYPNTPSGVLQWFIQLFQLYRGPVDATLVFAGDNNIEGEVWFTPYGGDITVRTSMTPHITQNVILSLGAMRFNTVQTSNVQIRIPYYSLLPALATVGVERDGILGHLSIQVTNFSPGREENLRLTAYLSFTDESQFMYPRGAVVGGALADATHPTPIREDKKLLEAGAVESSVDPPLNSGLLDNSIEPKFENYTRRAIGNEMFRSKLKTKSPYIEPRVDLAKLKIEQAFRDLRKEDSNHVKSVGQCRDCFIKTGDIVRKVVPTGYHYGIKMEEGVFHVSPDGSKWWSSRTAECKVSKSSEWCKYSDSDLDPEVVQQVCTLLIGRKVNYDIFKKNCESYANGIASGQYETEQGNIWKAVMCLLGTTSLVCFLECIKHEVADSLIDKASVKLARTFSKEAEEKMDPILDKTSSTLDEVKTFLAEVKETLGRSAKLLFPGRSASKYIKWICRIVKLACTLGIVHLSGYKPSVIGLVVLWTGIDLADGVNNFQSAIVDELEKLFSEHTNHAQSKAREILTGVMLLKNVKELIVWVYGKFRDWIDDITGRKHKIFCELMDNNMEIYMMVAETDVLCAMPVNEHNRQDLHDDIITLIPRLRTVYMQLQEPEFKKHTWPITNAITQLQRKLKEIGKVNISVVCRGEPSVLYLYGPRGSGKSMLSMAVAGALCKEMGVDYKTNIYTKPICGEYWDGYAGQLVCIIDDIGQSTDDEDWRDFCQLVSTAPMRLNMAHLDNKGAHFTSPFIICTSNLEQPVPKTLYNTEAVERRLHFKCQVTAMPEFQIVGPTGIRILDVAKAKAENKFLDLECLNIQWNMTQKVSARNLVQMLLDRFEDTNGTTEELLKSWAQHYPERKEMIELKEYLQSRELKTVSKPPEFEQNWTLWEEMRNHRWWILGGIAGIISLMTLGVATYHLFKNKKEEEDSSERAYSGKIRVKDPIIRLGDPAVNQSTLDITKLVQKNLGAFGWGKNEDDIHWTVNFLGIRDEFLLVPSHGYGDADEGCDFFFERNGTIYSCPRSSIETLQFEEQYSDVVILRVPTMPKFKLIVPHFVSEGDVEKAVGKPAILSTMHYGNFTLVTEGNVEYRPKFTYAIQKGKEVTISDSYRAKAFTQDGMCGGALVSSSNVIQNAILGVHVAAGGGYAATKIVTRENLEKALENSKAQRVWKVENAEKEVHQSSRSEYSKSEFYEYMEKSNLKCPSALPNNPLYEIDPTVVMMSKYSMPIVEEPPDYQEVSLSYVNKLRGELNPKHQQLTEEEAIQGIDGMEGIDMKTSPGIPFVYYHKTKKMLIRDSKLVGMAKDLKEKLEDDVFNNRQPDVTFMTTAKDELRPPSKVLESKTRAIHAAPLHFVVFFRQLFGFIIALIQRGFGFRTHIAVGIDPESCWDALGSELFSCCSWGVDLDFSNFDASLSPFMITRAVEVLALLSGVSVEVARMVSHPIAFSKNQIQGLIYHVKGSMPSGAPATSVLNSIINVTNIYYSLEKTLKVPMSYICTKIRLIVYGDDVLLCFKKDFIDDPSDRKELCFRLVKYLQQLGLKPTSAAKSEISPKCIEQLTFLKREFFVDFSGKIHPMITTETVFSMLAWKTKKATMDDLLQQACWFMYHHGEHRYKAFVSQLFHLCRLTGRKFVPPTWRDLHIRFLANLNCAVMPGD
uniref:Genome polyprotein n=1 Tax=Kapoorvirus sp. TaxID=3163432 RepID=A0AAU7SSE5_9VIRU